MKTPKSQAHKPDAKNQPTAAPHAETRPVMSGDRAPRLPHEHDESASSQRSVPRKVIEQAYTDVQKGLQDTGMGPPMDAQYRRTLRSNKS